MAGTTRRFGDGQPGLVPLPGSQLDGETLRARAPAIAPGWTLERVARFFQSSGAVNPALTIMANALRVGDHLRARLG